MAGEEQIRVRLEDAHAEALRVGDSPLRADQLERKLNTLLASLGGAGLSEEMHARVRTALESAIRVLRREEDGREAAKHLSAALVLFEAKPRKPSPFLDD